MRLFFLFYYITPVHALTTKTANIIQGYEPEFVITDVAQNKLGFTIGSKTYSQYAGNINSSIVNPFSATNKLSDFIVQNYTASNLNVAENYADRDGDIANSQPFNINPIKYTWYDATGQEIPASNYGNMIGCDSNFKLPLKLKIYTDVKALSQYGIPNEGEWRRIEKNYQIEPKGICYLSPNAIKVFPYEQWIGYDTSGRHEDTGIADGDSNIIYGWNSSNITQPDATYGGGFTADYVPNKGFRARPVNSNKFFPTTGFVGAQFQLIMEGAQSDYSYSVPVNPGNAVTVDSTGNVLFVAKPTGKVTVRATLRKNNVNYYFDYSFTPTDVWAKPYNKSTNWQTATLVCNGAYNVLSSSELTNSRVSSQRGYAFTRAIGGGIFNEWGRTEKLSYPNSNWERAWFLTRNTTSDGTRRYIVSSYMGDIYFDDGSNLGWVIMTACRG